MKLVPPAEWVAAATEARDGGYTFFDWLGCVDEIGHRATFRIVLAVRDFDRPGEPALLLGTEVPRHDPRLASLGELWAGAGWHEREAADLFGVRFSGSDADGPPARRLLLDDAYEGSPLRKDDVLGARAGLPWPGAPEPGEHAAATSSPTRPGTGAARRRASAPGVPDPAVWGDRGAATPAASAEEVAESAVGGRARRRRP